MPLPPNLNPPPFFYKKRRGDSPSTVRSRILETQSANLKAYYPMDDSSGNIVDASGNGKDMAPTGSPIYGQAGYDGNAIEFTGTQYFLIGENLFGENFGADDTLLLFINTTSFVDLVPASIGFTGNNNPNCYIQAFNDGTSRMRMNTEGGVTAMTLNPPEIINDGEWHMVAVVCSGAGYQAFIDGQPVQAELEVPVDSSNFNRTSIGALARTSITNQFVGLIQNAAFYNKALTASEMQYIFDGS